MLPRGFTLKPTALWNAARSAASYALSHALKMPIIWGRPVSVMIEPISRCNLQCPLCPIGARELKRELGTMSLESFKKILDNLGKQLRVVALWNQGEPTINDALPEMIREANSRGIYTMTSTNGTLLLRRRLVERLIDSGLDEIIFSIDGLTQETYQTYRVGGHLDTVIEGMRALRALRDDRAKKRPKIVMQWLPMKHNQHELPLLRETAAAWGADTVEIKTTQIYTDAQAEIFLPDIEELRRYERKSQRWETKRARQSCRRLWFSTVLDWDGTVVPCCFDKDEEFPMGNALLQDFSEIWRGEGYKKMRRLLLSQGRTLDMCQNCTEGLSSYYLQLDRVERLSLSTHKRISRLEKPPVEIAGFGDADSRAGRD